MEKITIVLVDDHTLFLEGLKAALKPYNFIEIVATFNTANKALNFLKKETIDLVITDISMPELNGIEFIKKLKKQNSTIKVIAISMFKPVHFEENFYDGYLLKDAEIKTLVNAIKSVVYEDTSYFSPSISSSNELAFSSKIVTKREKEVINLIAQEFTVDEIAEALFLSRHTVETHKKNIFLKLQVKSNAGLIQKAIQLGVLN
ncbi:Response regulator transcription factor [Tenacibaculum sp. 190524A02b]|uniref:response regulator transcription factor n=1 Tax=Tenacibaculum vairaonense TaxID=3137860 RepID=UPI0032B247BE